MWYTLHLRVSSNALCLQQNKEARRKETTMLFLAVGQELIRPRFVRVLVSHVRHGSASWHSKMQLIRGENNKKSNVWVMWIMTLKCNEKLQNRLDDIGISQQHWLWQAALAHFISDRFMCWMKRVGKPTATSKGAINYRICQLCPQRWLKTNWCQYRGLNSYWYLMDKQPHNRTLF